MEIYWGLVICGIASMLSFVLRQALVSFVTGAVTVVGSTIVLCASLGLSFETTIIVSTLSMIVWSFVFLFIYEMFE